MMSGTLLMSGGEAAASAANALADKTEGAPFAEVSEVTETSGVTDVIRVAEVKLAKRRQTG